MKKMMEDSYALHIKDKACEDHLVKNASTPGQLDGYMLVPYYHPGRARSSSIHTATDVFSQKCIRRDLSIIIRQQGQVCHREGKSTAAKPRFRILGFNLDPWI